MPNNRESLKGLSVEIDIRTEQCICGSQKKPEECCGIAKSRRHTLSVSAKNYKVGNGLAISRDGQVLRKVGNRLKPLIGKALIETSQLTKTGKNKITTSSNEHSNINLNPDSTLLSYEHALIVDTNTKIIGNTQHCATGIFRVNIQKLSSSEGIIGYDPALLVQFKNPIYNPERIGWIFAIAAIKQSPQLSGKRIGLITDHDINAHRRLNYRIENIAGTHKIPKNIRLIYAASDRGSHALNKLMRKADILASHGIANINDNTGDWIPGEGYFCDSFSISKPNPEDSIWAISNAEGITYSSNSE